MSANFIEKLVESLPDKELSELGDAVHLERKNRILRRFYKGEFPTALPHEIQAEGIKGIKAYRERASCSLWEAKCIIENMKYG